MPHTEPHQEPPVPTPLTLELKPRVADDGSEVIHHRRHKLDRGGRVFRLGSDISHSGSDASPIWTSPLHASLLPPLTIVRQRKLLDSYWNELLSDDIEEEVEVKYIEDLHILLESDSRLGVFVPKEVVTYLLDIVQYNKFFVHLSLKYVDWQTHIISILCNAVRSSEIDKVMREKVLESIMKLFKSDSIYVKAELLFGLTRLSKVDEYRRLLLELGILDKLLKVSKAGSPVIIPDCALLLSVICFTERNLPDDMRDATLQIGLNFLKLRNCNYEATAQAFSALAYLSNERYVAIEGYSCKRLMLFISDDEDSVAVSALEVVGNIVRWGKVRQITTMIKNGLLERLQRLLSHKFIMVRKEACWIISNITVGRKMYLKDLCEVNLPDSLCNLLEADDLDLRMEAVWAIFNSIIYGDDHEQINYPNRSSTHPYILGQTRKIAPEPSLRVMATRWKDYKIPLSPTLILISPSVWNSQSII